MRTTPDVSRRTSRKNGHVSVSAGAIARKDRDSSVLLAVTSLLLGLLVAVLGFFALMMWLDSHSARDAARSAEAKVSNGAPAASMNMGALESFAGVGPSN